MFCYLVCKPVLLLKFGQYSFLVLNPWYIACELSENNPMISIWSWVLPHDSHSWKINLKGKLTSKLPIFQYSKFIWFGADANILVENDDQIFIQEDYSLNADVRLIVNAYGKHNNSLGLASVKKDKWRRKHQGYIYCFDWREGQFRFKLLTFQRELT